MAKQAQIQVKRPPASTEDIRQDLIDSGWITEAPTVSKRLARIWWPTS